MEEEDGTTDPRRFRVANSQVSRHPRGRLSSSKDGKGGREGGREESFKPVARDRNSSLKGRQVSLNQGGGGSFIQQFSFSTLLASSVRNNERGLPLHSYVHPSRTSGACVKLDGNSGNKSARSLSKDLPIDFKVNTRYNGAGNTLMRG